MPDIFGSLFDFDGNGTLDPAEQGADFLFFEESTRDQQDDETDDSDDSFLPDEDKDN